MQLETSVRRSLSFLIIGAYLALSLAPLTDEEIAAIEAAGAQGPPATTSTAVLARRLTVAWDKAKLTGFLFVVFALLYVLFQSVRA